ncbi:MAG: cation:proton antiporter [Friedmanniella sp.]
MSAVETATGICALAASVLVVTALAERLRFSAPLLLMLVGIGTSFLPFLEPPELTPELVLVGLLPPLLYAAAIRSSVIDFRVNASRIGSLSVGLVVFTALGVGLVTWLILPVSFAVAFALGAVVAPPDAVAATSIARRIGLPRRVVTILEGESLLNDATAITCLRVALIAIGGAVTAADVGLRFLVAALGGAAVGVAVAFVTIAIRKRVTNPVFDTAISLLVPFAAYLPAERLPSHDVHGSGVIAVVVAGLLLGHKSPVIQSGQSRLSERVNWATIQFLLENTVFLLIGLQARRIITDLNTSTLSAGVIAAFCVAVLVAVIVLRLVWVAASRFVLFRRSPDNDAAPPWSETLVIGWSGLRGVVTLAAAFLIPVEVQHRAVLIFAAMVVTAGTLLIQGLTLPPLVRLLPIRGPDARSDALQAATVLQSASNAGLTALEATAGPQDEPATVQLVRDRVAARPDALWEKLGSGRGNNETPAEQYRRLRLAALQGERDEVLKIRSSGTVDHDIIEQVLASLDIEESMLTIATERADRLSEGQSVATPIDPSGSCPHLELTPLIDVTARSEVCEDCVREGTRTVHLRMCLSCGNVGCCDSSSGRHAERHFKTSHHPVMRSHEPGESWRWCYVDERLG